MPLPSGTRLGHYEIIELIGAGGMGEVYKARDPRLNRTVAVKVLLKAVSEKPEASARFEREARTIAGLHHPHICVVYDVGRQDNTDFLVMEFLEGETLASCLERGRLPLDQTLKFAIEIADALDKAHRNGVTHRDLKPGNIMITRDGVKLLDFGLAKLRDNQNFSTYSQAPTKADVTEEGTIVGSLQYMAPEQLEGREADARTDLFAFGATLHEMVTGQKAFEGKSSISLMSAILKDTPEPITALQPVAPETLERVITTCLAKDPDDRWQSARDLYRELKWVAAGVAGAAKGVSGHATAGAPGWRAVPVKIVAAIAVIAILITGAAVWMLKPAAPPAPAGIVRLTVALEPGEELQGISGPPAALSSDGKLLAYASTRPGGAPQLYLRSMDNPEPKPVPGSDGATNPFFSPNGQWVGFFSQGKLKKAPVMGGAVETLADARFGVGGAWAADDTIYFAPTNTTGLWKVSASGGGVAQEVSTLDRDKGEVSHRWPQVLPGGKAVLFTVWTGPGWDETELHVLNLETKQRHVVIHGSRNGRFYPKSGHLVYFRDGTDALMAVPFDLNRLQVTGSPAVTLAEHARDTSEAGEFTISDSGALAYTPSSPQWYESRLVWVDRHGGIKPLAAPLRAYQEPAISPDGQRIAISIAGPAYGVWIYDLARTTLTSLTSSGSSQAPIWSPDGKRVVYRGTRLGFRNIYERAADGSVDETRLTTGESIQTPGSFSADGKLVFQQAGIRVLSMDAERKTTPLWTSTYFEWNPHLSRDGRWLAYESMESGKQEIYVRPFPKLDGKRQISTEGGTEPVWSRDGRELFYRINNKMMVVSIAAGDAFAAGLPQVLFEGRYQFSATSVSAYDVSPDGKNFLMVQPAETVQPATQIHIVLNWSEELSK